jgi:pSer/pThr/pTyr-binding forkhead associated (FHA) protein
MELTLKVISGKHAGQKLRIPAPKFLIGRGDDCQLRPSSDLVSRHHCILLVGSGGAVIRDLGSRNGTFVNDQRVAGDQALQAGDRLTIGQLKFEVLLKAGEPQPLKALDLKEAAEKALAKHDDDLDVLELFKEDQTSMRDTVRMEASETITTRKESLVEEPAPDAAAEDSSPSAKQHRPAPPRSQHKDGGEAAAQILKKLLKGH